MFDSRIRGKYKSFVRYEVKQSHWLVGGSTDSVFKYTLFCKSDVSHNISVKGKFEQGVVGNSEKH